MAKNRTIYFPAHVSGTGKPERLSFSTVRIQSKEFERWLSGLNAENIRSAIGAPFAKLHEESQARATTISTVVIDRLRHAWDKSPDVKNENHSNRSEQLSLFSPDVISDVRQLGKNGTFSTSKDSPIQRWYPYLEGFSEDFADSYFSEFCETSRPSIFDPFCGSGTTVISALKRKWHASYCEINPFMVEVIRVKTEVVPRLALKQIDIYEETSRMAEKARRGLKNVSECKELISDCFPGRPYFMDKQLQELVTLKGLVEKQTENNLDLAHVMRFALCCVALQSSNLKRAGDVRYRRQDELLDPSHSVIDSFLSKIAEIAYDAPLALSYFVEKPFLIAPSALDIDLKKQNSFVENVDLVFTSPPYLNGTNYIRNTKLELWLMGLIRNERDLAPLRKAAVTSGICDVFSENRNVASLPWIEDVARSLDSVSYDRRIPLMVRSYMSDSQIWVNKAVEMLKPGGHLLIDIGDSIFAGVHVPTVEWLAKTCEIQGLQVDEIRLIRKRKSKNGAPLKQSMIVTSKRHPRSSKPSRTKNSSASMPGNKVAAVAKKFAAKLPYRADPYNSRNWGHPLHSLCSYQGKLKPALAHFLVSQFTSKGDTVLDPLSGAGTVPLECMLQGRVPYANDLQELAYLLSTAKCSVGDREQAEIFLEEFIAKIEYAARQKQTSEFNDFGFNGKLPEYFHPDTYKEVLCGRKILMHSMSRGEISWAEAVVYSCWLHLLHGNRPYALSRRSHPVTPFKPTGEFEYRDLRSRITAKVTRTLDAFDTVAQRPESHVSLGDFKNLDYSGNINCVITSPPFANSTRFYVANWMRLWAAGWDPGAFKSRPADFIETKQKKDFTIYGEFLNSCRQWLTPSGIVIMHLGKTKVSSMADNIATFAEPAGFKVISKFDECVADCEKFGVRDQGATTAHEFLILEKQ